MCIPCEGRWEEGRINAILYLSIGLVLPRVSGRSIMGELVLPIYIADAFTLSPLSHMKVPHFQLPIYIALAKCLRYVLYHFCNLYKLYNLRVR